MAEEEERGVAPISVLASYALMRQSKYFNLRRWPQQLLLLILLPSSLLTAQAKSACYARPARATNCDIKSNTSASIVYPSAPGTQAFATAVLVVSGKYAQATDSQALTTRQRRK